MEREGKQNNRTSLKFLALTNSGIKTHACMIDENRLKLIEPSHHVSSLLLTRKLVTVVQNVNDVGEHLCFEEKTGEEETPIAIGG